MLYLERELELDLDLPMGCWGCAMEETWSGGAEPCCWDLGGGGVGWRSWKGRPARVCRGEEGRLGGGARRNAGSQGTGRPSGVCRGGEGGLGGGARQNRRGTFAGVSNRWRREAVSLSTPGQRPRLVMLAPSASSRSWPP